MLTPSPMSYNQLITACDDVAHPSDITLIIEKFGAEQNYPFHFFDHPCFNNDHVKMLINCSNWSTRLFLTETPYLDDSDFDKLIQLKSFRLCTALAKSPNISPTALLKLVSVTSEIEDWESLRAIAGRDDLPYIVVDFICDSDCRMANTRLAQNFSTSDKILKKLISIALKNDDNTLLEVIASNPNLTFSTTDMLVKLILTGGIKNPEALAINLVINQRARLSLQSVELLSNSNISHHYDQLLSRKK